MTQSESVVCRGEIEETKKSINGNKTIMSISTKPDIVHQSTKGCRIIAGIDYFNTATFQSYFILTMCLIPFSTPPVVPLTDYLCCFERGQPNC